MTALLPSGQPDPGTAVGHDITAFIQAIVRHHHPERNTMAPQR
ncbi:hypothetical protein [Hydrogenophaga sp.]|nr:hypothetical protein [Hydrogenophaga sp.]